MEELNVFIRDNPMIAKAGLSALGLAAIVVVTLVIRYSVTSYVSDSDTRYRLRKFITFAAYILAVLLISLIFRAQLGGLTVALGVAGAGIAFALQEVIASFAGWLK